MTNRTFEFLRQKQKKITDLYTCKPTTPTHIERKQNNKKSKNRNLEIWHFKKELFLSKTCQTGAQSAKFDLLYSGKTLLYPLNSLKNLSKIF